MAAEASGWAWKNSPYKGAVLLVHLAIADVVNDLYGYEFWASMTTLAGKARTERKTASNAVAKMMADGYLEIPDPKDDHRHDKSGKPTRYRFLMPERAFGGVGPQNPPPAEGGGSTEPTQVGPQNPGGGSTEPTNPKNPTDEPNYVADFEAVWAVYPKRKNNPKKPALAAYKARRKAGVSHSVLLGAAQRYAASRVEQDPNYTMQASTFFGPNERWADWIEDETPVVGVDVVWDASKHARGEYDGQQAS